jgi:hypothetical protein
MKRGRKTIIACCFGMVLYACSNLVFDCSISASDSRCSVHGEMSDAPKPSVFEVGGTAI